MAKYKLELIVEATSTGKGLEKTNKALNELDKNAQSASKGTNMLAGASDMLAGALTVSALVAAGKTAIELAKLGAAAQQSEAALSNLAGGSRQAAEYINAVKEASGNTVSSMDAMQASITAQTLGVVDNADQMARLTEIAVTLGKAQGLTATQAVSDLTTALGRQSPMILDNLGITMKASEAYAGYAASLGKPVSALTDLEKKQAFVNEALAKGAEVAAQLGGSMETNASKIEQGTAALDDLKAAVGKQMAGALGDTTSGMAKYISRATEFIEVSNAMGKSAGGPLTQLQFFGQVLTGTSSRVDEYNARMAESAALADLTAGQMGDYAAMAGEAGTNVNLLAGATVAVSKAEQDRIKEMASTEDTLSGMSAATANAASRTEAQAAAHKKAEEAILAQASAQAILAGETMGMAESLMEATDAQIASTMISMLDPEAMGADAYSSAVGEIGKAFGIMDEESIALAENLPALAAALEEGIIPTEMADEALAALVADAADGNVEFSNIVDNFGTATEKAGTSVESFDKMGAAMNIASQSAAPLANSLGSIAQKAGNIEDRANAATGAIERLLSTRVSGDSGGGGGGAVVDGLASGGPVEKGSAYVVGEQGPELFVPDASGQIVPGRSSSSGSAAAGSVHVHIGSLMVSDSKMVDELANKIARSIQQQSGSGSFRRG